MMTSYQYVFISCITVLIVFNAYLRLWNNSSISNSNSSIADYRYLESSHMRRHVNATAIDLLEQLLFPNQTTSFEDIQRHASRRRLDIVKPPYNPNITYLCTKCRFSPSDSCSILDKKLVEERYLPTNVQGETCAVIESFGKRIQKESFGVGKTFRDTPQCREISMQYLCATFGSDNRMYRNYCTFQEVVNSTFPDQNQVAIRAPCRSFCVQVATVCANDPTFIQTCDRINCPPIDDSCTSDPSVLEPNKNVPTSLDANLGCSVPYYRTPYGAAAVVIPCRLTTLLLVAVGTLAVLLF